MRKLFHPIAAFACIALVQTAASGPAPDPSDPRAAVSPVRYESSFERYRRLQDDPALSWKGVNELVRKLGGWSAYASGKVPDEPKAEHAKSPSPAAPAAASGGAHTGHGKH